jgi:hypothetical protein
MNSDFLKEKYLMKSGLNYTGIVVLAASLVFAPFAVTAPTYAAQAPIKQAALQPFPGTKLKTFMLTQRSYIQIKDIYFLLNNNEKTVHFTLDVYNGDSKSLDFMDYWMEIQSASGSKYTMVANPANPKITPIAPKTTEQYRFYAKVNPNLNYTDLVFKLVKWDFNAPGYVRTIGQARVTQTYKNIVPTTNYFILRSGNEKLKTSLAAGNSVIINDDKQLQINFNLENVGYISVDIPNYQFYLKTKQGYLMKLNYDPLAVQKINPSDKMSVLLIGKVKKSLDLNGAQILLTKLEGEAKFESPVALFTTKWNAANTFFTEANTLKNIIINDTPVEATIKNVYVSKKDSQNEVTFDLMLTNRGKTAIKLPKYLFQLMGADQSNYSVTYPDQEVELAPALQKKVTMKASVPSNITDQLTLLIQKTKEETKPSEYLVAGFKLPSVQNVSTVTKTMFTNASGSYEIEVKAAERLPWGNQDQLNVYIDVRNTSTKSETIPDFTSKLTLNGLQVDDKTVTFMKLDNQIMLAPKGSTRYVLSTKIPYTYNFNEVLINLGYKTGTDTTTDIANFYVNKLNDIPVSAFSNTLELQSVGRRASLQPDKVYTLEGKDSDLLYVDFRYINDEQRYSVLPALKAYFKTKDGQFIEGKIQNVKTASSPGGRSFLAVTAKVPKTFVALDLQLIVGEGIAAGQYTAPDAQPDGYINAKAIALQTTPKEVKDEFNDLLIKPYSLTFNKIENYIKNVTTMEIDLTYNLKALALYENNEAKRKIIIQAVDGTNVYEKSFDIDVNDGFQVGENLKIAVSFTDPRIAEMMYKGYKLNVFEEFDGYRRLLASRIYTGFFIER